MILGGCVAKEDNRTLRGVRSEALHVCEDMGMRAEQTNLLCNQALLCRFSCFVHSEVPGLV